MSVQPLQTYRSDVAHLIEDYWARHMQPAVLGERRKQPSAPQIKQIERRNLMVDLIEDHGPLFTRDLRKHLADHNMQIAQSTMSQDLRHLSNLGIIRKAGDVPNGYQDTWEAVP